MASKTNASAIDVAIGSSCKSTNWKNQKLTWAALVERLTTTTRTPETVAEYNAASKTDRGKIKDVGGFVGGFVSGGRRLKNSIRHRQIITLDADFATADTWPNFKAKFPGTAACVYSTHSHTEEKPKLRIIIPVNRPLDIAEYMAASRWIAAQVGIEDFDPTTYEPERLMYWPSTSQDGIFYADTVEGEPIDGDLILGQYTDWSDSSSWPTSEREGIILRRELKKMGNPLEKEGVVGAFCRAYSIEDAIDKFLSDKYAPGNGGRYTFIGGTSHDGLKIYEPGIAHTFQATDPLRVYTSSGSANAFDLVRVHLYGDLDADANEKTNISKLPSTVAMRKLAAADSKVKVQLAQDDFDGNELTEFDDADEDAWKAGLVRNENTGRNEKTIGNFELILRNDINLKGRVALDEFIGVPVCKSDLPWRVYSKQDRWWSDHDRNQLQSYIERRYNLRAVDVLDVAFDNVTYDLRFHPVRDYLKGLKWDGVPRVDRLLVDYLGAEDSEYTRTVTRKTLAGAVARIFEPGTKFDHILTLVGEEGRYKSSLAEELAGDWFSDAFSFQMVKSNREAIEQIQGAWIIEIAEMAGIRKSDGDLVKSFTSRKVDKGRMAYGRFTAQSHRQSIFIGTTNKEDFLREMSGNRRFWPVLVFVNEPTKRVKKDAYRRVKADLSESERNQIWAEAVVNYLSGEFLYLSPEMAAYAKTVQTEHTVRHHWSDAIEAYLEGDADDLRPPLDRVCIPQIWEKALGGGVAAVNMKEQDVSIIHSIMRLIPGWVKVTKPAKYGDYGPQRNGYFREGIVTRDYKVTPKSDD